MLKCNIWGVLAQDSPAFLSNARVCLCGQEVMLAEEAKKEKAKKAKE